MDKKDILNDLETIDKWLKAVAEANDLTVKETGGDLDVVLLNLQIEDAHIPQDTGIVPITYQIERVVGRLHNRIDILRKTGRKELHEAFIRVKDYIENMEV